MQLERDRPTSALPAQQNRSWRNRSLLKGLMSLRTLPWFRELHNETDGATGTFPLASTLSTQESTPRCEAESTQSLFWSSPSDTALRAAVATTTKAQQNPRQVHMEVPGPKVKFLSPTRTAPRAIKRARLQFVDSLQLLRQYCSVSEAWEVD